MSQLVRLEGKHSTQNAHCTLVDQVKALTLSCMLIIYIVARRCGTRTWCILASTELPALLCLVLKQEKSSTTTLRLIEWLLILRYYIWGVICGAAVKWLWTTIVESQIFRYVFALSSVFQNQSNPVFLSPLPIHGSDQLNLPCWEVKKSPTTYNVYPFLI